MPDEKTNQEKLIEYLVSKDGYLESDISNNKVIMISGKWGSGKTYFWKEQIQKVLNKEEKKIPNHYISLYGKTSIKEIENEIFLKIFESVDSSKTQEKGLELTKNTIDLVTSFSSAINFFGLNLDISKLSDKPFSKLEEILKDKKLEKTVEYLNNGAIICFDDFERKSKEIDLNDLFGFITQLATNFKCKVVIILNDDVFEGEEKKIFSKVKEKSVSKYLKYEPTIEELFETIWKINDYEQKLKNYKYTILQTIKETGELNARIYIQVLDNLKELKKYMEKDRSDILANSNNFENVIRCFILVNINFILYHTILNEIPYKDFLSEDERELFIYHVDKIVTKNYNFLYNHLIESVNSFLEFKIELEDDIKRKKESTDEQIRMEIKFLEDNILLFRSIYFANKLQIGRYIDDEIFEKINNFIETGIII